MTREEAIECLDYQNEEFFGGQSESLKMAISVLSENKGEWIPVTERLPKIHQEVLLSLRSLDVDTGFRAENEPYFYVHGYYIEPQDVLAWQPLPKPYKAKRGK